VTIRQTLEHWRSGIRLYIAIAAGVVTLEVWWWASVAYGGSPLFAIRLEEVFAWLALGLLVFTMLIGPAYKIWPQLPGKMIMRDARRLTGVAAAWFAALHASINYIALFKWANPLNLPTKYQQAFLLGVTALLILLALAFTSFDRAFRGLGIWWFRLHRLVYFALVLSILHMYLIGTQGRHALTLGIIGASIVCLCVMHGYLWYVKRDRS
jgi:sulfoxide reductase heme-binding subunit YedZ